MKKVNIYIGLNDKDTKRQEISTLEAYKMARNAASIYVGGASIYELEGIYRHEDCSTVIEKSLKIEIVDPDEDGLKKLIYTLKATLNQETILKTEEYIEVSYL